MNKDWERRISAVRPLFELAGFALTTFTWNALAFVTAFTAIRSYWTPVPALVSMGWQGSALHLLFISTITLISVAITATLNIALLSLLLSLNSDMEHHNSPWVAVPWAFLSKPIIWASVAYVLISSIFLGLQFLAVVSD